MTMKITVTTIKPITYKAPDNYVNFMAKVGGTFLDGYIAMLALGGISHQVHHPHLALGYWTCVLIAVISVAYLPQSHGVVAQLEKIRELLSSNVQ